MDTMELLLIVFTLVQLVLLELRLALMPKLTALVLKDMPSFLHQLFANNVLLQMQLNVVLVYLRPLNVKPDTQLSVMLAFNAQLMLLHVLNQELSLKLILVTMDTLKPKMNYPVSHVWSELNNVLLHKPLLVLLDMPRMLMDNVFNALVLLKPVTQPVQLDSLQSELLALLVQLEPRLVLMPRLLPHA